MFEGVRSWHKHVHAWHALLFVAVGVGLGFLAWWPFGRVNVTTDGVKWTDLVTAFGIPVTIILTAVFALHQLKESEKSRYASLTAELTRRWDEEPLIASRRAMIMLSSEEIRAIVVASFTDGVTDDEADKFFLLQKLPNFIDRSRDRRGVRTRANVRQPPMGRSDPRLLGAMVVRGRVRSQPTGRRRCVRTLRASG